MDAPTDALSTVQSNASAERLSVYLRDCAYRVTISQTFYF